MSVYPFVVGLRKAKLLMLIGDSVTGVEAARIGMANASVPAAELADTTRALALRVAKIPKDMLVLNKASVNTAYEVMGFRAATLARRRLRRPVAPHGSSARLLRPRRARGPGGRAARPGREVRGQPMKLGVLLLLSSRTSAVVGPT